MYYFFMLINYINYNTATYQKVFVLHNYENPYTNVHHVR